MPSGGGGSRGGGELYVPHGGHKGGIQEIEVWGLECHSEEYKLIFYISPAHHSVFLSHCHISS